MYDVRAAHNGYFILIPHLGMVRSRHREFHLSISLVCVADITDPPEVRRREYLGLGVFLLQYLPLVNMKTFALLLHKHEHSWVVKKRNTSEVTQATKHPLAIILTAAQWALVSIIV